METQKEQMKKIGMVSAPELGVSNCVLDTLVKDHGLKCCQFGRNWYYSEEQARKLLEDTASVPANYRSAKEIAETQGLNLVTLTQWCRAGHVEAAKRRGAGLKGHATYWADPASVAKYAKGLPTRREKFRREVGLTSPVARDSNLDQQVSELRGEVRQLAAMMQILLTELGADDKKPTTAQRPGLPKEF